MREIKFRLWLPSIKKMSHALSITDWANGYEQITVSSNCVWMQYTGIKDKNVNEIYESDILIDLISGVKWIVRFGKCEKFGFTGWYVEAPKIGRESTINADVGRITNRSVEIIGNIYQNPELL